MYHRMKVVYQKNVLVIYLCSKTPNAMCPGLFVALLHSLLLLGVSVIHPFCAVENGGAAATIHGNLEPSERGNGEIF